jgi:DNA (cytosine-5)-methyltransferase 1
MSASGNLPAVNSPRSSNFSGVGETPVGRGV